MELKRFPLLFLGFFYGFRLFMPSEYFLKYIFLSTLSVIILVHFYLKKVNFSLLFSPSSICFLLFIFLNILSLTLNGYGFKNTMTTGAFWFHEFISLYFLSLFFRLSPNNLPTFFCGLLFSTYLSSLLSIIEWKTKTHLLDGFLRPARVFEGYYSEVQIAQDVFVPRVSGFFYNPNVYAYSLSLALMILLLLFFRGKSIKQKTLIALIFLFGVVSLGMTYSRGGWISFCFGLLSFLWMIKKQWILPVIITGVIMGFTLFQFDSGFRKRVESFTDTNEVSKSQRIGLIKDTWKTYKKSPLWGIGLYKNNQVIVYKDKENPKEITNSHNMYLEFLVGLGPLGLLVLMGFFFSIFNIIFKSHYLKSDPILQAGFFASTIVFLTSGIFCTAFKINEIRGLFFSFLSVLFYISEKQVQSEMVK